ncbi:MAG: right-handed parallel beta-helix repeat-containing protein [Candidatus Heimdallarchaeota archaeon]|nr:right-handed parallel beta-helix repeat-containing protein [Candidatus Heimdallarchaeota archaeon]MCK4612985.1 right-handed parallel beta-helix repeat-containing protein [Candidatus Heimdallarchaeota archaeon]
MSEKKPMPALKGVAIAFGMILLILSIVFGTIFISLSISYKNYCNCRYASVSICTDKEIKKLSSSGDGTLENPYVIDNSIFDFVCIGGWDSRITVHFVIQNCTFDGLCIDHVTNFVIQNCSFIGENTGLYLDYCDSFVIQNCTFLCKIVEFNGSDDFTIDNCDFNDAVEYVELIFLERIEIFNTLFENDLVVIGQCLDVTLENNSFESSTYEESQKGLFLYELFGVIALNNNSFKVGGIYYIDNSEEEYSYFEAMNNTLKGQPILFICNESDRIINETYGQIILLNCTNVLISNQSFSETNIGITISDSSNCTIVKNNFSNCFNALNIYYSTNCSIYNNSVINSFEIGIFLISSDYNIFKFNQIQNSTSFGLYLWGSSNNQINHNNFLNNSIIHQAEDYDGEDNNWNYNFWNDWIGIGNYSIKGTTDSYDYFPLSSPVDL